MTEEYNPDKKPQDALKEDRIKALFAKAELILKDIVAKNKAKLESLKCELKKSGHPPVHLILLVLFGFVFAALLFVLISRISVKNTPKKIPAKEVPVVESVAVLPVETKAEPATEVKEPVVVSKPTPSLILTGIVFSEDGNSLALINNRIVRVGGSVDGAILKEVRSDQVELSFEGEKIILRSR